jgi:hypothetical protein
MRTELMAGGLAMKIILLVVVPAVCLVLPLGSQQRAENEPRTLDSICQDQSHGLASGAYVYAVARQVWPPAFPVGGGITVVVEMESAHKLFLHSNGSTFQLWFGRPNVPGGNIWTFLEVTSPHAGGPILACATRGLQ